MAAYKNIMVEEGRGKEYHVSPTGDDAWEGTASAPLRTISAAAVKAMPGDVITVHEGTYREQIVPPRGGESSDKRIVYQAAAGENVEIKGSEIIRDWENVQDDVWKAIIPNHFFGKFNPYSDLINGDWFDPKGRDHHTGAVYLNGDELTEAVEFNEVTERNGNTLLWYANVDESNTTIWADFGGANPNRELVEINVRQSVFYPEQPFLNYITIRGFTLRHAATPWAPPTAEQIGLIGTHWSKGWVIENNEISHSRCVGITLGKYGDEWDNEAPTADAYNKTIERALQNGWHRGNIGHHIVRWNTISHCEQAGIVGSLGAAFSVVTGNHIHDIHVKRSFTGAEIAGIKFHAPIDTVVSNNLIYNVHRGIWFDWMTQGTRLTGNLLFENDEQDLFVEVNHGPFLVDHNLFLSGHAKQTLLNMSQGGAYAHNLIIGAVTNWQELNRSTPFHRAHSTEVSGLSNIPGGDDRYFNNIFVAERDRSGLSHYDTASYSVVMDGNVFINGALPSKYEENPLNIEEKHQPEIKLIVEKGGIFLQFLGDAAWKSQRIRKLVTSELLGETQVSKLSYEDFEGKQIRLDSDYFGREREENNPSPGPFEMVGSNKWKVWPVEKQ